MDVQKGKALEKIPTENEVLALLGESAFEAWNAVGAYVEMNYDMDVLWDSGRKAGVYEKKYRRSGKTLCALYAREREFGFMVVFGQKERADFEANRSDFSREVNELYEATHQYHDGKWLMLVVSDSRLLSEIERLLRIKKKPKRKDKSR